MKSNNYLVIVLFLTLNALYAQYDPSKIFVTDFYNYKGDSVRSASGKPGSGYWQNEANYTIKAAFDVNTHLLDGNVTIDYVNNSPDELDMLWLQLDQNTEKPEARGNILRNPDVTNDDTKGYNITSVKILKNKSWEAIPFIVKGTRMQIRLERLCKA